MTSTQKRIQTIIAEGTQRTNRSRPWKKQKKKKKTRQRRKNDTVREMRCIMIMQVPITCVGR